MGIGGIFLALIAIGLFLIIIIVYLISIFNNFISLKNNIDKSWANIDVLLKQRSDELPNLVETVKGYMKHEKKVLTDITKARTEIMGANTISEKAKADRTISGAIKSIFAVAENYPKLMANQNFLKLQDRITGLENEIADRREFYNDSVTIYNTRIHSFPDLFFANWFRFSDRALFSATENERKVVEAKV